MKSKKRLIAARSLAKYSVVILGISTIILVGLFIYFTTSPSRVVDQPLTIPPGTSVLKVGEILRDHALVRSPRIFQLYVKLKGLQIQAGDYTLSSSSLPRLATALTEGKAKEIIVTFPEGLRREQIGEIIEAKLSIPQTDFLANSQGLEGRLFPDTYSFRRDETASSVAKRLNDAFIQKTSSLALTPEDIILASIVEREALTKAEKPIIAGILKKRISEGWALEVDATIQYIMGKPGDWWPTPLLGDRTRKSPYNTYQNRGLPPAPISNPGLISLEAVKNPTASPYYFYLHDKSGVIHYAATNSEHEQNINKYITR